jgi:hypothetical protein
MNIVKNYNGSIERIDFIVKELSKVLPELSNIVLTCDGGRAWGKGVYISDCLFTVRIYTPLKAYEYDNIHGLRDYIFEGIDNIFNKQLKDAQEALAGMNNHFTIEQAKSFLQYNQ